MTTKTCKTFFVLHCARSDWDGYVFYDEWSCLHGSTSDIDKAAHFDTPKEALAYTAQFDLGKIDEEHFTVHKVTQMQVVQKLDEGAIVLT